MRISTPRVSTIDGISTVTADVESVNYTGELWFRMPEGIHPSQTAAADAVFPFGLILSMSTDQKLELEAPVSSVLLANSDLVQKIFSTWYPDTMELTQVNCQERVAEPTGQLAARGAMSTFTGGVDSFYTLSHAPGITDLLYVNGYDLPLDKVELWDLVRQSLSDAAADIGKRLFIVETNLKRDFLHNRQAWGRISYGACITSVAHLLSEQVSDFHLAGSHTYLELYPRGSHALLDPLWSTDRLRVHHHGADMTRVKKTLALIDDPVAQKHLRVCLRRTDRINCGRCEKCYRTKTTLLLAGVLDKFQVFDQTVNPSVIAAREVKNEATFSFLLEMRDFAKSKGNAEIEKALSTAIKRYQKHESDAEPLAALETAKRNVAAANAEVATANAQTTVALQRAQAAEKELARLRSSRSWRWTAPLRKVKARSRAKQVSA
ncbi:MAG: hypothetical protein LBE83_07725 [Propionibacteriaceae bacterium]|jgi:hypothetical protein|nr:hypothetical protein [Propionibacteriaceae bacterium]